MSIDWWRAKWREKNFNPYTPCTGSGESGKSTILKQMKIINLNGYSNDELFTWRATVYRNVVESAQTIVQAVRDSGAAFERSELNVNEG